MLAPWKKSYEKPREHIKKQRHYFADKGPSSQSYGFSSSCIWVWELHHKKDCAPKNWCCWTVVLEKTLESPWASRRSTQSILKESNPEYSLEGLMLKMKLQHSGHLMQRTDALEDSDAEKDWRQEGKGRTEDEMVGWHHQLNRHGFEQAPGIGDGQGSLACYSPQAYKDSDTTEWLKWNTIMEGT